MLPDAARLAESSRRLPPEIRNAEGVRPYIDPGFVNKRLIRTYLGRANALHHLDRAIDAIPAHAHPHEKLVRPLHIYSEFMLEACDIAKAPSLSWLAAQETPEVGTIICSTDTLKGTRAVFKRPRAEVVWMPPGRFDLQAKLVFSTEHICSSTSKEQLSTTSIQSHISYLERIEGGILVLAPFVIGGPWLRTSDPTLDEKLMWHRFDFFQRFIEDVDQFSKVRTVPRTPTDWIEPMSKISEEAVKRSIAQILGDRPRKDWGGEMSDHYTTSLQLYGRRITAAFVFKGPARFAPMTANHLGKNGDQIYRLSCEPADLLVLQHCHEVTAPVIAQLRAFTVKPASSRLCMVIDGCDTYRLLKAYDLIDEATEYSKEAARGRKRK